MHKTKADKRASKVVPKPFRDPLYARYSNPLQGEGSIVDQQQIIESKEGHGNG